MSCKLLVRVPFEVDGIRMCDTQEILADDGRDGLQWRAVCVKELDRDATTTTTKRASQETYA